jgi:hypothetical protein
LLRITDGTTVGHVEVAHISRVIAEPKDSMALITKVLGET